MSSGTQTATLSRAGCAHAADRALQYLAAQQNAEGYWKVDLTADSTLESDYILLQLWLHPPENGVWNPPTRNLIDRAVEAILARQLADGGFNIYPAGPSEVNATVKAYFALKLAGIGRRRAAGAVPRAHSRARRHSGVQQLRQDQPQPVRSVSAQVHAVDSAGDDAARAISSIRCRRGRGPSSIPLSVVQALNPGDPSRRASRWKRFSSRAWALANRLRPEPVHLA